MTKKQTLYCLKNVRIWNYSGIIWNYCIVLGEGYRNMIYLAWENFLKRYLR